MISNAYISFRDILFEQMASGGPDVSPEDMKRIRERIYGVVRSSGWSINPNAARMGFPASTPPTERELLSAFMDGEAGAFQQLANKHLPELLRYARKAVPEAEAEDLVQEAFIILVRRARDVLNTQRPVRGFLRATIHKLTLAYWRKRSLAAPLEDTDLPDEASSALEDILRREEISQLASALEAHCQLLEQEIVVMSLEGKKPAEIASTLDLPVNRTRVMKHRALEKIKKVLCLELE